MKIKKLTVCLLPILVFAGMLFGGCEPTPTSNVCTEEVTEDCQEVSERWANNPSGYTYFYSGGSTYVRSSSGSSYVKSRPVKSTGRATSVRSSSRSGFGSFGGGKAGG